MSKYFLILCRCIFLSPCQNFVLSVFLSLSVFFSLTLSLTHTYMHTQDVYSVNKNNLFKNESKMHYLELVYCKNYLNLRKISILKLFKMAANQMEWSSFEQ